jgi:hypothetical protein
MTRAGDGDAELLKLEVAGARLVPAAAAAAGAAAAAVGMGSAGAERVRTLVERLAEQVCAIDFDDPDEATFEVSVHERADGIRVRLEDHGLPFSLDGEAGRAALSGVLEAGLADRLERRADGDRNVVWADISAAVDTDHLVDDVTTTVAVDDPGALRAERLEREHLDSLARCTWRVYGHTYVAQFLYHPAQTWRMVEDGRLHSVVVLDADDEVVGHVGVELERRGEVVGDVTLALTDPRYRGHGVLGLAGSELGPIVADLGLVGTLAEAVTPHTITQRFEVESGAVETGILIGFIPRSMTYRGFPEEVQGTSRQSAVLCYRPMATAGGGTVHLPDAYAQLMRELYERMALERHEGVAGSPSAECTRLDVVVDRPRSLAALEVGALGADAVDVVDRNRRELCAAGTEVVYAELPLDDPGTPGVVEGLRARGFFYGGFVPHLRGTDVLRMQYLDVEVDTSIIQLYTDEARRLLRFQLDDRQ